MNWWDKLYEGLIWPNVQLYKANPCDVGGHRCIASLGKAFAALAVDCRCCSGARVLAAAALTAYWPPSLLFMVGIVLAMWGYHAVKGEPEAQS